MIELGPTLGYFLGLLVPLGIFFYVENAGRKDEDD